MMIPDPEFKTAAEILAVDPNLVVIDDDRRRAAASHIEGRDDNHPPEWYAFMRTWTLGGWTVFWRDAEAIVASRPAGERVVYVQEDFDNFVYYRSLSSRASDEPTPSVQT
jgi:hypothetical protein